MVVCSIYKRAAKLAEDMARGGFESTWEVCHPVPQKYITQIYAIAHNFTRPCTASSFYKCFEVFVKMLNCRLTEIFDFNVVNKVKALNTDIKL